MNNDSLKFRVFKAIMALPVPVCIIIQSILLYVSNWQPGNFLLWRFLLGIVYASLQAFRWLYQRSDYSQSLAMARQLHGIPPRN